MRATVSLDDSLLKTAQEYSGLTERAELLREALKALIARESGRRLLALAGTAPQIEDVRRLRAGELLFWRTLRSGSSCFAGAGSSRSWMA